MLLHGILLIISESDNKQLFNNEPRGREFGIPVQYHDVDIL